MLRHIIMSIALVLATPLLFAADDEDAYNEYTILPSHFPVDAPRFEDYSENVYRGARAAPNLHSNPTTRMFRTRLKEWAKVTPNFAGHFILATWGCGTECTQISIIDAYTGKIYHPFGARWNAAVNVHQALLQPTTDAWHGAGAIRYREDSRLLVLIGMPEERVENRGISFYVWDRTKLKRIRFIPVGWYPDNK